MKIRTIFLRWSILFIFELSSSILLFFDSFAQSHSSTLLPKTKMWHLAHFRFFRRWFASNCIDCISWWDFTTSVQLKCWFFTKPTFGSISTCFSVAVCRCFLVFVFCMYPCTQWIHFYRAIIRNRCLFKELLIFVAIYWHIYSTYI